MRRRLGWRGGECRCPNFIRWSHCPSHRRLHGREAGGRHVYGCLRCAGRSGQHSTPSRHSTPRHRRRGREDTRRGHRRCLSDSLDIRELEGDWFLGLSGHEPKLHTLHTREPPDYKRQLAVVLGGVDEVDDAHSRPTTDAGSQELMGQGVRHGRIRRWPLKKRTVLRKGSVLRHGPGRRPRSDDPTLNYDEGAWKRRPVDEKPRVTRLRVNGHSLATVALVEVQGLL
mmetsp:Transcript_3713/g.8067  ORF Transcript_3713/g.8067 Transcript_3713/m.8067 type:complete len:227 (-) Transcript_3713:1059-1739(-)